MERTTDHGDTARKDQDGRRFLSMGHRPVFFFSRFHFTDKYFRYQLELTIERTPCPTPVPHALLLPVLQVLGSRVLQPGDERRRMTMATAGCANARKQCSMAQTTVECRLGPRSWVRRG